MEKLKRLREERGLSQVKLAARADLNPATVNQIERGMRDASPGTLRKLADALEVSLYELLEEEAPKAQASQQLELEERRGASEQTESTETLYTAYEALGRVLASDWAEAGREWSEKVPTEGLISEIEFGQLLEWTTEINHTLSAYKTIAQDQTGPERKEMTDTLKLMEKAVSEAWKTLRRAFEPVKTFREFRQIWEANGLDAITSEVEGR